MMTVHHLARILWYTPFKYVTVSAIWERIQNIKCLYKLTVKEPSKGEISDF